jgi:hypothetical protein
VAAQFRRRGQLADARRVLIEAERRRRRASHGGTVGRIWSWLLRITTGYGWELWRTAVALLLLVGVGTVVASVAFRSGLMVPTSDVSKGHEVRFVPLSYSLDLALPIVDLKHESLWLPTGRGGAGLLVQVYFWVHIAAGWLLATLFAVGVTAAARRSDEG